jgi:hypothetical protein
MRLSSQCETPCLTLMSHLILLFKRGKPDNGGNRGAVTLALRATGRKFDRDSKPERALPSINLSWMDSEIHLRKVENSRSLVTTMRWISIALLALHTATLIYVLQKDSGITVGVEIGNVICAAEFPTQALRSESLREGAQMHVEMKRGKLRVRRKDGKTVTAPIIWVQRTLAHPLPE